jgi:hypothetical protein
MPSKPLHEILGEMIAEAGPLIFQAMQQLKKEAARSEAYKR